MTEREAQLANRFALAHFGRSFVALSPNDRLFCLNRVTGYLQLDHQLME